MNANAQRAADSLNRRFLLDYPGDAARRIEQAPAAEILPAIERQTAKTLAPVWRQLLPQTAARLMRALPDDVADALVSEMPPPEAVRMLAHMPEKDRLARLERIDPIIRADLDSLLDYPPDSAGYLMDPAMPAFRAETSAAAALGQLRESRMKTAGTLFLVDDAHRLVGLVALADVALAAPATELAALSRPVIASVRPVDPLEEIADAFESGNILDLPVIDLDGVLLGAVTHDDLAHTIQEDATIGIQTMVGASREERALSTPLFAVAKRMPWLQINLLTAFLAAAVVGMFEQTIAQVTALAVLLPVVAGQSGNAGAQALAITMRGLALREITVRQWARVMRKEVLAGFLNGIGIAITCGLGVYLWSQSLGLVAVIAISMVLAMVTAGFAGALIPVALTKLGQDPATSSSIILTTVTDVAGFFSFLGIATLLMQFL